MKRERIAARAVRRVRAGIGTRHDRRQVRKHLHRLGVTPHPSMFGHQSQFSHDKKVELFSKKAVAAMRQWDSAENNCLREYCA